MQQNILDLHNKISLSLAKSLKSWDITQDETLAYMIFFEALWEDELLIKNYILIIWKADSIFTDLITEIEWDNKESIDTNNANLLLQKIKTNTF